MRAMLLNSIQRPLEWVELPTPIPKTGQVLLKVQACGVCRTDLHIVDGELGEPKLPLIFSNSKFRTIVHHSSDRQDYQEL